MQLILTIVILIIQLLIIVGFVVLGNIIKELYVNLLYKSSKIVGDEVKLSLNDIYTMMRNQYVSIDRLEKTIVKDIKVVNKIDNTCNKILENIYIKEDKSFKDKYTNENISTNKNNNNNKSRRHNKSKVFTKTYGDRDSVDVKEIR